MQNKKKVSSSSLQCTQVYWDRSKNYETKVGMSTLQAFSPLSSSDPYPWP